MLSLQALLFFWNSMFFFSEYTATIRYHIYKKTSGPKELWSQNTASSIRIAYKTCTFYYQENSQRQIQLLVYVIKNWYFQAYKRTNRNTKQMRMGLHSSNPPYCKQCEKTKQACQYLSMLKHCQTVSSTGLNCFSLQLQFGHKKLGFTQRHPRKASKLVLKS